MSVKDIEKAQPKKDTYSAILTKETMKVDGIPGTKAKPRVFDRPRNTSFSTIEYADVTKRAEGSNRMTNPLMPTY